MEKIQLTFQNHPLKSEIIDRWDKGESNKAINLWLKAEHSDVVLGASTLCKHYKRYERNQKRIESSALKPDKKKKKKQDIPVEEILWETIEQCRRMKEDATISPKEWQYLDQQLQLAVEKLIKMGDTGKERDISNYLTEMFAKIEADETSDKLEESNEVKPTEVNTPSS